MSDKIEEMSSVAGMSMEASSGRPNFPGKRDKKRKNKKKRANKKKKNEEEEQEKLIREIVKKGVQIVTKQKLDEEQHLRNIIRKMVHAKYRKNLIFEQQEEEPKEQGSSLMAGIKDFLESFAQGKGQNQFLNVFSGLETEGYRAGFIKQTILELYRKFMYSAHVQEIEIPNLDEIIVNIMHSVGVYTQKVAAQKQAVVQERLIKEFVLEKPAIIIGDDGVLEPQPPTTAEEVTIEEEPEEVQEVEMEETSKIGTAAAKELIEQRWDSIEKLWNSFQENAADTKERIEKYPGKDSPQKKFVTAFISNLVLLAGDAEESRTDSSFTFEDYKNPKWWSELLNIDEKELRDELESRLTAEQKEEEPEIGEPGKEYQTEPETAEGKEGGGAVDRLLASLEA